jgi:hypothetical protein
MNIHNNKMFKSFSNPEYFSFGHDVVMPHTVFPQEQGNKYFAEGKENSLKMENGKSNNEEPTKQGKENRENIYNLFSHLSV